MIEHDIFGGGDWRERLSHIMETMRLLSRERDPQSMVRVYRDRLDEVSHIDRFLSISRRGLEPPLYRIARSSTWKEEIDPWTERERLPVLQGGLLGELLYGNEPRIFDNLEIGREDPAFEYLDGMRSLVAIPVFDGGEALNLVIQMRRSPHAFDPERFPLMAWLTNLFSRATHNLLLSRQLAQAHRSLDREARTIAEIQRSILPERLPDIPGIAFAVEYHPSARASGDYYDFLELEGGRWGIMIADGSGHGTSAAVLMAITHTLVHVDRDRWRDPSRLLEFLNESLVERYTQATGSFVTAFYGIFDPATRELRYSLAGHPPPRIRNCTSGSISGLETATKPPLGMMGDIVYEQRSCQLHPGDRMLLYTDGLSEARNQRGEMFGLERVDSLMSNCSRSTDEIVSGLVEGVRHFSAPAPPEDDLTLVLVDVR